jgi:hypothetical protein
MFKFLSSAWIRIPLLSLSIFSCAIVQAGSNSDSPISVYEDYYSKLKKGMSFNEEKAYFSSHKIGVFEQSLPIIMKELNKNRADAIAFYSYLAQSTAECNDMQLLDAKQIKESVKLVYSQINVCEKQQGIDNRLLVEMVKENGWKIHNIGKSL